MNAYVLEGAKQLAIRQVPMPQICDDEVLIKVSVCGTCHSEFPGWLTGSEVGKRYGHEAVGVVEQVGKNVKKFVPGDRVTGMLFQAFAQYTKAPWWDLVKVPAGVSDLSAILEPWSCLFSGAERLPVRLGDRAGLVGAGYMGLGFMQLLLLKGVSDMVAVDTREDALENALRFGATQAYLASQVPTRYIVDTWDAGIFDRGLDIVVETSGNAGALDLAGRMVGVHGALAIAGFHNSGGKRVIDMELWNWKGFEAINAHERRFQRNLQYMEAALRLIQAGKLDTQRFMTHAYGFSELNRAFADMGDKPKGYIKGYVIIDG